MTETDRIEFKRELLPDTDLEEEAVAFLNKREGGVLYFGIDKVGNAVGLKDVDGDMLKIKDRIRNNIRKTALERIDTPLWDERAVREAVINAIVHNDYTREVPPKFELFSDHLEITSFGRLPDGLSKEDFFSGVSIPRNKELMRVFRDLELVEALGSGMEYIMQKYGRANFVFLDNFIRMTIPYMTKDREGMAVETVKAEAQVETQIAHPANANATSNPTSNPTSGPQVTLQVNRLLTIMNGDMPRSAIMEALSLKDRGTFTEDYLRPAIRLGLIELTQPDSPRSPTQKYRLTAKGRAAMATSHKSGKNANED